MGKRIIVRHTDLARYIDHTLLKPDATSEAIRQICAEAEKYKFASVCVNSSWVTLAHECLQGTGVNVVAVVGFPLGAMHTVVKAYEARLAVEYGADEIDMVMNIGQHRMGDFNAVQADIRSVVDEVPSTPVKVILETALLSRSEIAFACVVARDAGAKYVKTCTGFNGGAATVNDILLMRETVGTTMGIKASGGISTAKLARELIQAGATRLGTSRSISILSDTESDGGY